MASQLAELKEATDDIEETVDDGQAGLDAFAGDPPGTTRSRKPTIARQTVTMAATTTTPTPDSPTSRRRRETETPMGRITMTTEATRATGATRARETATMPARSRQARGQRRCRRRRDRWRRRGRRSRRRSARARLHHREGPLDARRTRHPAGDARGRRLRALRPGCRRAQVGGGLRRLDARLRSVDVRAGRRALAGVRPPRDGRRGDEPLRPARHIDPNAIRGALARRSRSTSM